MRHQLSEADEGTTVSAHTGDEIDLCLHGLPSGGYRWLPDDAPNDKLEPLGQDFTFDQGSVGGRNQTRFRFRVKAAGRAILRLRYARSWEAAEPPLQTYELIIDSK